MYGGIRRRKVVSVWQRIEFLVFLVPIAFFFLAWVVLYMTLMPAPTRRSHQSYIDAAARARSNAAVSASALPSPAPPVLCGHPMHGVSSALWSSYCVGVGSWLCFHSRELLDSAAVNDDYCDCADGTDEPGTSACAGREGSDVRFSCKQQHNSTLPLSRINDGICDCCDG